MLRCVAALSLLAFSMAVLAVDAPGTSFDDLVPAAEVREALVRLDPAALADVAAKVAAAEAKLGKEYPRLPAKQFYELALRVAGEKRAVAVVDRLVADERVKSDPRLSAIAAAARLAATASRSGDPEMNVALDQITPEQFALFRGYLTQIQDAKALADHDALKALADHVAGTQDLSAPQRKYLAKLVTTTIAGLPAKPPAALAMAKKAREEASREVAAAAPITPTAPSAPMDPPMTAAKPPAAGGGLAAQLTADASALVDEGFEGRIDLAKIGKAWGRSDPVALADYAFRMAEEERIMGRAHRNVPAKVLFQASFGLAIANGDSATITRLEKGLTGAKAPDFEGKEEFLAKLTASKGLVASSRKGRQPFLASVEMTAPESFRTFRLYLDRIHAAVAQKDAVLLAGLVEGLDTVIELDDAQRAFLRESAKGVAPGSDKSEAISVLRKLEGDTRNLSLPPMNAKVYKYARDQVGKKVDAGESQSLALRAIEFAGARDFPPRGPDADYIWGTVVKKPSDALPGDLLQFRDVVFKFAHPDGKTQTTTYSHHTAIVYSVDGPGRFTLLEQNAGPEGKPAEKRKVVQLGSIDLAMQKQGTVWIYRPVER